MNRKINLPSAIAFRVPVILALIMTTFCPSRGAESEKRVYIYHASSLSARVLKEAPGRYDSIALTGFRITSRGSLVTARGKAMKRILRAVESSGGSWHPVISFASPRDGQKFLKAPPSWQRAVRGIRVLAKKHALNKIHLDFEYIEGRYAPLLANFLSELKKNMPGLQVSMALFPQVDFSSKWKDFHNPKLLAPLLDEVVIMCYDYHRPGTRPGPVTSLMWAEKNIRYYLRFFSGKKMLLGIPAYGYLWASRRDHITLSARFAAACRTCRKSRHLQSQTLALETTRKGKTYRGFIADQEIRKKLTALARSCGLRGTALWRLGFEEK